MMNKIILIGLSMCLILLGGCKTINHSNIPFCKDINETGIDCHSPSDTSDLEEYNYEEAVCKTYYFYGTNRVLSFCFDTLKSLEWETNYYGEKLTNWSIGRDDEYCYPDNSRGIHCICDIVVFPDGRNETKNCHCLDDLVMYYTCINKTNLTIIKGVEIKDGVEYGD